MIPPAPLPDCVRCGHPAHDHNGWRCPRGPSAPMIVVGAIVGIVAALIWLHTRTDAALCSSALVTALDPRQCQVYATVHTVAGIGFLAGSVIAVIGSVRRT